MNIEEIESEIKKAQRLCFKGNYEFNNFEMVINHMLDRDLNVQKTYFSNSNRIQCKYWLHGRGVYDIYRTVLYYFPDTKLKDVLEYLKKSFAHFYCYDTKQTVFNKIGTNFYSGKNVHIRINSKLKKVDLIW